MFCFVVYILYGWLLHACDRDRVVHHLAKHLMLFPVFLVRKMYCVKTVSSLILVNHVLANLCIIASCNYVVSLSWYFILFLSCRVHKLYEKSLLQQVEIFMWKYMQGKKDARFFVACWTLCIVRGIHLCDVHSSDKCSVFYMKRGSCKWNCWVTLTNVLLMNALY